MNQTCHTYERRPWRWRRRLIHTCDVTQHCRLQGGVESYYTLSLLVIFRERALYIVALLRKMTCNLKHPMPLHHPVVHTFSTAQHASTPLQNKASCGYMDESCHTAKQGIFVFIRMSHVTLQNKASLCLYE